MNPHFMRQAIRLALASMREGCGGPFGAVIVRDGQIVARGQNRVTSSHDPTAHAEVVAIRRACRRLRTFDLSDCEIYANCEPCPMCLAAIYWARIPRVYFGNTRADAAAIGFDDDEIYRQIALPVAQRKLAMIPCLREETLAAFEEWRLKPDKVAY